MRHFNFFGAIFLVSGLTLFGSPVFSDDGSVVGDREAKILNVLTDYYGLTEDQVLVRLAHEAEAAQLHLQIRELIGDAYAGAWFDGEAFKLKVGLTNPEFSALVERLGATAILMEYSAGYLSALREQIEAVRLRDPDAFWGMVSVGVDHSSNRVVLGVLQEYRASILEALIDLAIDPESYELHEASEFPRLSNQIRGADCFENPVFSALQVDPYECSIGFSVQGGFITAGHCGAADTDPIKSCDGVSMGVFKESTWHSMPQGQRIQDSGWVETHAPWLPVAVVNGYASGDLSITAESGGHTEVLVNSTVCRYGAASGGPHCGQVLTKNQTVKMCGGLNWFGGCTFHEYIQGATKTDICVEPGDSGGSYLSATGHAQGTTIGGVNGTCPLSSESWFQPVKDTLDTFQLDLLTSHGPNPPTITAFTCPDYSNSGGGQYQCRMNFDTQGATTVQWSSSGGNSNTHWLFGSCNPFSTVFVTLNVTNSWGTAQESATFPCPTGPLQ